MSERPETREPKGEETSFRIRIGNRTNRKGIFRTESENQESKETLRNTPFRFARAESGEGGAECGIGEGNETQGGGGEENGKGQEPEGKAQKEEGQGKD